MLRQDEAEEDKEGNGRKRSKKDVEELMGADVTTL